MFPILQIGPLALQVPGLLIIAGLWVGLSYSERHARTFGLAPEALYNLVFYALLAALLGARLTYAGRFPDAFIASPGSLISLNPGLLDPLGGLAVGGAAALYYGQRKELALWPTLDALTPFLAAMALAIAAANLASGDGFGRPADLPWAVELWGTQRHPSQVYEMLAAGAILFLLRPSRRSAQPGPAGSMFLFFVFLTSLARVFLEGFRGDSSLIAFGLRGEQVAAWIAAALSLTTMKIRRMGDKSRN